MPTKKDESIKDAQILIERHEFPGAEPKNGIHSLRINTKQDIYAEKAQDNKRNKKTNNVSAAIGFTTSIVGAGAVAFGVLSILSIGFTASLFSFAGAIGAIAVGGVAAIGGFISGVANSVASSKNKYQLKGDELCKAACQESPLPKYAVQTAKVTYSGGNDVSQKPATVNPGNIAKSPNTPLGNRLNIANKTAVAPTAGKAQAISNNQVAGKAQAAAKEGSDITTQVRANTLCQL